MEQLSYITQQPEVMGGKACIRGMCVTVGMIVGHNRYWPQHRGNPC